MFNSLKGKIFGNKEMIEDNSEIGIMKDENKILKEKIKLLFEENEKMKQIMLLGEKDSNKSSNLNRFFKDFKTMLFENRSTDSVQGFKQFLCENLIYSNIDEEDVDFLNSIDIKEHDWNENRHIFIFKQRLLEKNYKEMFKNALILNELKEFHKNKEISTNVDRKSVDNQDRVKTPPRDSVNISQNNTSSNVSKSLIIPSTTSVTSEQRSTNISKQANQLDVFEMFKEDSTKKEEKTIIINPFENKSVSVTSTASAKPPLQTTKPSLPATSNQVKSKDKTSIPHSKTIKPEKPKNILDLGDSFEFEEFDSENLLDTLHEKSNVKKQTNPVQSSVHNEEICKKLNKLSFSNDKRKGKAE
jgi:hypothetical protein